VLTGFRSFIARGNVVDLAVAVVIGTAFGAVVASLVADLLTPLIGAIFGEADFSGLSFEINGSEFTYGNFINALIAFLSVAAAIYFFVVTPMQKLDELRHGPQEAGTRECPECLSEVPAAATRCAFCTSQLPPVAQKPAEST
jgi:large conductance mechanosensitive channel